MTRQMNPTLLTCGTCAVGAVMTPVIPQELR